MLELIRDTLSESRRVLEHLIADDETLAAIGMAAAGFAGILEEGGRVFSCGNGGSMCDAMHFAEELSGRFRRDRPALSAIAVSDPGHISCTANDFGYSRVFSRFIEAHGRKGDGLLAISTSGNSENVIEAARTARGMDMSVVALTGKRDCPLAGCADIVVATEAGPFADRVQELHIKVIHIVIELIERRLYPENYEETA